MDAKPGSRDFPVIPLLHCCVEQPRKPGQRSRREKPRLRTSSTGTSQNFADESSRSTWTRGGTLPWTGAQSVTGMRSPGQAEVAGVPTTRGSHAAAKHLDNGVLRAGLDGLAGGSQEDNARGRGVIGPAIGRMTVHEGIVQIDKKIARIGERRVRKRKRTRRCAHEWTQSYPCGAARRERLGVDSHLIGCVRDWDGIKNEIDPGLGIPARVRAAFAGAASGVRQQGKPDKAYYLRTNTTAFRHHSIHILPSGPEHPAHANQYTATTSPIPGQLGRDRDRSLARGRADIRALLLQALLQGVSPR